MADSDRSGALRPGAIRSVGATDEPGEHRRFNVVRHGYERTAVDEFVRRTSDELVGLRRELARSERRREHAERHAAVTEQEMRTVRAEHEAPTRPADSVGFRAEKLLRFAELEAADIRVAAAGEATMLLEHAAAEAESVRARALGDARSILERAAEEVARLADVRGSTRAELARLADLIETEIGRPRPRPRPRPDPAGRRTDDGGGAARFLRRSPLSRPQPGTAAAPSTAVEGPAVAAGSCSPVRIRLSAQ